jgi:nickel-dependent lactate racemase
MPGTSAPLFAVGGPDAELYPGDLASLVRSLADRVIDAGARRVLVVPPDHTRLQSRAGEITAALMAILDREVDKADVMPALGTHRPLGPVEARLMFGDAIPAERLLAHDWRRGVKRIGELPAEEVDEIVGEPLGLSLPFFANRCLVDDSYDLIVSIGQVVPHEVAGFGGYTKHVCIGLGGGDTIQRSHFISAVYGIERTMGLADAPVRRLLDLGFDRFLEPHCAVLFVLTVVESTPSGPVLRGAFSGVGGTEATGGAAFRSAVELSSVVNIDTVRKPFETCVAYLDPAEFHSTWLGNKAIYRTRRAMADGGTLYILAPGVERFAEDEKMDELIRRYGYRGREAALAAMADDPELAANLAVVAHLIHGSSEGRFEVVYCPGPGLTREDVERVGFGYLPYEEARLRFAREHVSARIPDPALGLWRA